MVTEAGGLVGNFTGESDYLYQREIVAANPRIYAQLVTTLAPYTRVIKEAEPAAATPGAAPAAAADATQAFVESAASPAAEPAAPARKATRIRKADLPSGDDAPF